MDASDLSLLLETLEDNVDDLKETLALFLKSTLPESVGNLPLLDKAQLYVLITYAIESLLFCELSEVRFPTLYTDDESVLAVEWRECQGASYISGANKS